MQGIELYRLRDRLSTIISRQLRYDDIFSNFVNVCETFFNVEMKDEIRGSVSNFARTNHPNQATLTLAHRTYLFDLVTQPGKRQILSSLLQCCRVRRHQDGKVETALVGEIKINGQGEGSLNRDGISVAYNIQIQSDCLELVTLWIEKDFLGEQE